MWQGKPVFVRKRTQAEIDAVRSIDFSTMKDPQDDAARVQKPEWLIVIGVCTHLGCIPNSEGAGYLCACHGSVYDASGRIIKGPAPANLPIPPYVFDTDTRITIG
jgi:ubiquinol-cytochrome c reductase iron-sulfur subunit